MHLDLVFKLLASQFDAPVNNLGFLFAARGMLNNVPEGHNKGPMLLNLLEILDLQYVVIP